MECTVLRFGSGFSQGFLKYLQHPNGPSMPREAFGASERLWKRSSDAAERRGGPASDERRSAHDHDGEMWSTGWTLMSSVSVFVDVAGIVDSDWFTLSPGGSVITGRNNAGKSSSRTRKGGYGANRYEPE